MYGVDDAAFYGVGEVDDAGEKPRGGFDGTREERNVFLNYITSTITIVPQRGDIVKRKLYILSRISSSVNISAHI